ncbi:MAG: glutamyl-tRNA reductase [Nannocystaceae bacterium]
MKLFAVGLNHATAPVALREQVAVPAGALGENLTDLMGLAKLSEGMLLSTCNRVEVYGVPEAHADPTHVVAALARLRGVQPDTLEAHCFTCDDQRAARHIFRVAASLESMVVGEPQILGQVKDAFRVAEESGAVGAVLGRCMSSAFRGAKRVRTETRMAEGASSVPAVAVSLARSIFGDLADCRAMLVGAGEMARQAGVQLRAGGVADLVVVNRSAARGRALATELDGRYEEWGQLEDQLCEMDIVVASTGSDKAVIGVPLMKRVSRRRRGRPIFFVDIAVPRDVETAVGQVEHVYVYNIDDLQRIVKGNMDQRIAHADAATTVVDEEVATFLAWQRVRRVAPLIRALQVRSDAIAATEIERALARLPNLTEDQQKVLRTMGRSIAQKLMHPPKAALRSAADKGRGHLADAAEQLFGLQEEGGE